MATLSGGDINTIIIYSSSLPLSLSLSLFKKLQFAKQKGNAGK
jgi:hypothetical protein